MKPTSICGDIDPATARHVRPSGIDCRCPVWRPQAALTRGHDISGMCQKRTCPPGATSS